MKKNSPLSSNFLRLIPCFTLISLVFAGISTTMTSCDDAPVVDTTTPGAGHANREDLIKIIDGGWVNTDYSEALNRVHSPMFAAEAGRPVQEMMFDAGNMKGDTMINLTGRLNFLDGERFDVVLFKEGEMTKMKIYQGSFAPDKPIYLDYRIKGSDTLLLLIDPATTDTAWYTREFHEAPMKAGVAQNALEHHVNRSLFEGEWKSLNGELITFNANGTVSGWDKWTWYSVEIDKYGNDIQPDVMSAYNDKMGATYVYTLDNDRLVIYEYDGQAGDGQWTRGKIVAEFMRK